MIPTLIAVLLIYLPILALTTHPEMTTRVKLMLAFTLGFLAYPLVSSAEGAITARIEQLEILAAQEPILWTFVVWVFCTALFYTFTVSVLTLREPR